MVSFLAMFGIDDPLVKDFSYRHSTTLARVVMKSTIFSFTGIGHMIHINDASLDLTFFRYLGGAFLLIISLLFYIE